MPQWMNAADWAEHLRGKAVMARVQREMVQMRPEHADELVAVLETVAIERPHRDARGEERATMTAEEAMAEIWGATCPDCGPTNYREIAEYVIRNLHGSSRSESDRGGECK